MGERILAICRFCGRRYRLPPSAAGRRARCQDCREIFKVPYPSRDLDDTVAQWLLEDQARETRRRESGPAAASENAPAVNEPVDY